MSLEINNDITRSVLTEKEEVYEDPKDLRNISDERLKYEGNKSGKQSTEWMKVFNLESAIENYNNPIKKNFPLAEINKWSILSNRFIIIDRKGNGNEKLFTKEEVLREIEEAYYSGHNDGADGQDTSNRRIDKHEQAREYFNKKKESI